MGHTYDGLNFSSVQSPAIINNEHSPNVIFSINSSDLYGRFGTDREKEKE